VSPFAPLSEPQSRALNTAAEQYGRFLDVPATVIT
jgi:hypothetical protein